MKDEEMAEGFANEKCKDCYMCSYSEHKNPYKICQRRKDRKQAFLAGLKAGRPQWHKVTDGDLPNENVKLVLVRDRWKNRFLNYHLLTKGMICEMIDQFDEWLELPIEE